VDPGSEHLDGSLAPQRERRVSRHQRVVGLVSGSLLVVFGVMLATGSLTRLTTGLASTSPVRMPNSPACRASCAISAALTGALVGMHRRVIQVPPGLGDELHYGVHQKAPKLSGPVCAPTDGPTR
jgi:hypothetical protein